MAIECQFVRAAKALASLTFAQARLSLCHSIEISCAGWNGDFCNVYVNSECCGESAPATTALRHCTKTLVLPKMAICVLFTPAANTLVSLHICAGKVTGQCDKYQDLLCWQRMLLGVCFFAQARLSLRHSIEISCAGWNGDMLWWVCHSNHSTSVQPSVRCINASKNAPSAL